MDEDEQKKEMARAVKSLQAIIEDCGGPLEFLGILYATLRAMHADSTDGSGAPLPGCDGRALHLEGAMDVLRLGTTAVNRRNSVTEN